MLLSLIREKSDFEMKIAKKDFPLFIENAILHGEARRGGGEAEAEAEAAVRAAAQRRRRGARARRGLVMRLMTAFC